MAKNKNIKYKKSVGRPRKSNGSIRLTKKREQWRKAQRLYVKSEKEQDLKSTLSREDRKIMRKWQKFISKSMADV
jgi:hypothetical protein